MIPVLLLASLALADDVLTEADCPQGTQLMGQPAVEQWCARGNRREGPYRRWERGTLRARGGFEKDQRTGAWVFYAPEDGSVVARGAYLGGQLDGLWVFVPGQGRWEGRFDQGQQVAWVGHQSISGDSGTVELALVDGVLVRRDTTDPAVILTGAVVHPPWLSTWNPEHFSRMAVVFGPLVPTGVQTALDGMYGTKRWEGAFDEAGRPDGAWTRWHDSGVKAFTGSFVAGTPVGDWQTWHRNGQLRSEGRFDERGRRVGPWQFWHDNGQLMAEGSYRLEPEDCPLGCEGVRIGAWRFLHRSGMRSAEADFDKGVLQLYDERGQPRPGDQAPGVPELASLLGALPSP